MQDTLPVATLPSGTVLAFDFGAKRTGVAVGELSLRIAHPLITIRAASDRERMQQVAALIKEWAPVLLVVGLPGGADGGEHAFAARCRAFARRLQRDFRIETRLVDERLTSDQAGRALSEAGGSRARDDEAAAVILQQWLDERARGGER